MKVAVVGLRGFPDVQGGIETHCEQLYPRLVGLGHDVFVYARKKFVKTSQKYEFRGCQIIPLWHFNKSTLEAGFHTFFAILHAFFWIRPDILHIHAVGPALMAPLARLLGMRVVVTHHGMDYNRKKWNGPARWLLRLGEKAGAHTAHRTIAISRDIQRHLAKLRPNKEFPLIYNGVNLPNLADKQQVTAEFRALGLDGKRYIFALGRFVPEKGFDSLVDAWAMLPKGSCELVIAGCADHETEYSRKLVENAQQHGVILPGFVKNGYLHDLFRFAHVFVIPSSHEGLPIALLEAMSYNMQIIASDIEPHLEMELPKECYFENGNARQLSEKIQEYLQTGRGHRNLQEIVIRRYDWDAIAGQTEKVYHEVSGLKPRDSIMPHSLQCS